MKTNTSDAQIKQITAALLKIHVRPFGQESGDPKSNAQRNLRGKTHYVDDETLRWHKSRVTSSGHRFGGLLFTITCSDALYSEGRKRGFRVAVFDVFGTCIERPKLEEASRTGAQAQKAADSFEIDLVKHYADALTSQHKRKLDEVKEIQAALAVING